MPSPVKISDTLLAQARAEAAATHRSATAQIEHWATIGRAVEALVAYRDVLALKRAGETLPLPAHVGRDDVRAVLARVLGDDARQAFEKRRGQVVLDVTGSGGNDVEVVEQPFGRGRHRFPAGFVRQGVVDAAQRLHMRAQLADVSAAVTAPARGDRE